MNNLQANEGSLALSLSLSAKVSTPMGSRTLLLHVQLKVPSEDQPYMLTN